MKRFQTDAEAAKAGVHDYLRQPDDQLTDAQVRNKLVPNQAEKYINARRGWRAFTKDKHAQELLRMANLRVSRDHPDVVAEINTRNERLLDADDPERDRPT